MPNLVKGSVKNHPVITAVFIIFSAPVFYYFLAVFPVGQAEKYLNTVNPPEDRNKPEVRKYAFDIENSNRLTIAQIIGGFALLAGLYFAYQNARTAQKSAEIAQKNLRITEEGKITDRFSNAVEMVGDEKLEVRLGGIYALERIARDSQKDHWTVMELLTAFVRENAPYKPVEAGDAQDEAEVKTREDIQAIMTVIGRRKWIETETQRLNLQKVNLAGCDCFRAKLYKARLSGTNLSRTDLSEADLNESLLDKANLSNAKLIKANLINAYMSGANLSGATLSEANLDKTYMFQANLYAAYLRHTHNLTLTQILDAKNLEDARLPDELKEELNERQSK